MKFSCEKCGRSYVADEKVRGRAFKMKCKTCGNVIMVKPGAQGTPGDVVFNLIITSTDQRNGTFTGSKDLSGDEQEDFKNGLYYVNVHTATNQSGEIRGQFSDVK